MIIGIPRETKEHEYRVASIPSDVAELIGAGHKVMVEHDAGARAGYFDEDYAAVGARYMVVLQVADEA